MPRRCSDWINSYMQYTENSEPPKLFHTWTAISTIAAVLQRKCMLNWGHLRFFPNMYIVLVGPPGKVRKGTAMSFGSNMLSKLQVKISADSVTREALIRNLSEAQESIIDEATGAMRFHSSLTVYAPELVVFLGYNQQQLMMDLTDWFDCGKGPDGTWTYQTKHQGTDNIIGIWVNLIGATTPDLLRSSLSMDAIGGGLTSRIIFVFEDQKYKSCPLPFISDKDALIGEDLYYDLEQMLMLKGEFKYTQNFVELWKEWYTNSDASPVFDDPRLAPYCERRPVHVMKLSMICSASRGDDMQLKRCDLERSISIIEKTEHNMPAVFSGIGKSPHADVLAKVMNEVGMAGSGGISLQALQRKFYHDADARVLQLIIQTLENMGFLHRRETATDTYLVYHKAGGM